jgi:hypothetical protein
MKVAYTWCRGSVGDRGSRISCSKTPLSALGFEDRSYWRKPVKAHVYSVKELHPEEEAKAAPPIAIYRIDDASWFLTKLL